LLFFNIFTGDGCGGEITSITQARSSHETFFVIVKKKCAIKKSLQLFRALRSQSYILQEKGTKKLLNKISVKLLVLDEKIVNFKLRVLKLKLTCVSLC
jgi:hypothetical protein